MYELISGKPLFFDASKRMEQIIQCIAFERIDFSVISDLHLRSVLEKILQRNAKHRPESAEKLLNYCITHR
jgi:serine/threonine protein kinase